ncbi:VOC family protein [Microvirga solisilvae]|uniref:VOC family protein n=1 Tax=Microvirga solisilvae TaxID=2919498 RepID=UPI001FAFB9CC|nr:VOC family protein [Microvirga solisilvae]
MSTIAPCLWFDGKAEEAARYYVSLLPDSRIDAVLPYTVETPGGKLGDVMLVELTLAGSPYLALNGGPNFQFTPAISFFVNCVDQAEVDRLWNTLLDGGTPMACGWITDRYGISWQIVPEAMTRMIKDKDPAKVRRVMEAMMTMVKLDLAALERAYRG